MVLKVCTLVKKKSITIFIKLCVDNEKGDERSKSAASARIKGP